MKYKYDNPYLQEEQCIYCTNTVLVNNLKPTYDCPHCGKNSISNLYYLEPDERDQYFECPSCQQTGLRTGRSYTCQNCNQNIAIMNGIAIISEQAGDLAVIEILEDEISEGTISKEDKAAYDVLIKKYPRNSFSSKPTEQSFKPINKKHVVECPNCRFKSEISNQADEFCCPNCELEFTVSKDETGEPQLEHISRNDNEMTKANCPYCLKTSQIDFGKETFICGECGEKSDIRKNKSGKYYLLKQKGSKKTGTAKPQNKDTRSNSSKTGATSHTGNINKKVDASSFSVILILLSIISLGIVSASYFFHLSSSKYSISESISLLIDHLTFSTGIGNFIVMSIVVFFVGAIASKISIVLFSILSEKHAEQATTVFSLILLVYLAYPIYFYSPNDAKTANNQSLSSFATKSESQISEDCKNFIVELRYYFSDDIVEEYFHSPDQKKEIELLSALADINAELNFVSNQLSTNPTGSDLLFFESEKKRLLERKSWLQPVYDKYRYPISPQNCENDLLSRKSMIFNPESYCDDFRKLKNCIGDRFTKEEFLTYQNSLITN